VIRITLAMIIFMLAGCANTYEEIPAHNVDAYDAPLTSVWAFNDSTLGVFAWTKKETLYACYFRFDPKEHFRAFWAAQNLHFINSLSPEAYVELQRDLVLLRPVKKP